MRPSIDGLKRCDKSPFASQTLSSLTLKWGSGRPTTSLPPSCRLHILSVGLAPAIRPSAIGTHLRRALAHSLARLISRTRARLPSLSSPLTTSDHRPTATMSCRWRLWHTFLHCMRCFGWKEGRESEGPRHFFAGRPANSRAKNLSPSGIAWVRFGGLEVREVSLLLQSDVGNANTSPQRNNFTKKNESYA